VSGRRLAALSSPRRPHQDAWLLPPCRPPPGRRSPVEATSCRLARRGRSNRSFGYFSVSERSTSPVQDSKRSRKGCGHVSNWFDGQVAGTSGRGAHRGYRQTATGFRPGVAHQRVPHLTVSWAGTPEHGRPPSDGGGDRPRHRVREDVGLVAEDPGRRDTFRRSWCEKVDEGGHPQGVPADRERL